MFKTKSADKFPAAARGAEPVRRQHQRDRRRRQAVHEMKNLLLRLSH